MRKIAGVAAAFILLCAACDKILSIPAAPRVMDGGGEDDLWSCYLNPPDVPPSSADLTQVRLRACDLISGTDCSVLVPGLTATLCGRLDATCERPIQRNLEAPNGQFTFDVPTPPDGFNGYLRITGQRSLCTDSSIFPGAPATSCPFAPNCDPEAVSEEDCLVPEVVNTLYLFNPPVREPPSSPRRVQMLATSAFAAITQQLGALDPATRGFLLVVVRGCDDEPAAGLRFVVSPEDESTTVAYGAGGGLSTSLTETDASGAAGIAVQPGPVDVAVETAAGERLTGINVFARRFEVTYVEIAPDLP